MKKDPLYQKLTRKLEEVAVVPPQKTGPFTPFYKKTTSSLKSWPLKILTPLAFLSGVLSQFLLGEKIVKIVSLLQKGF